ncbi:hypothetical protein [Actinomadura livida]|uniref:Uncharacterized protein n=1 Tax=Actinomadura livida TaxID=79909 RepID=A0A7W7MX77_9ACTN|nr:MULTISPECIES: hypothetical protein [Actinomadura]MBB4773632.1 hypothetical protein [Actinomadura catellatispora]
MTMLACAFAFVMLCGIAGVGLLLEAGERRRSVRWAHTLARFCGDPACGVCRSRSLSAHVPRVPAS